MPNTYQLSCRCGQLRGVLSARKPSNRCVCYCSDCQAFARHLGASGVLDAQGATDIIQLPQANLHFSQGLDKLACLRLTETGMLRWYAACCRTPIANTPASPRFSFVGLIHSGLRAGDQSLDAAFGPVSMRTSVESALGPEAPAATGLLRGAMKVLAMVVKARLSGAWQRSPFFDAQTGVPVAAPRVLSANELAAARPAN
jgi:hypothetical protein